MLYFHNLEITCYVHKEQLSLYLNFQKKLRNPIRNYYKNLAYLKDRDTNVNYISIPVIIM